MFSAGIDDEISTVGIVQWALDTAPAIRQSARQAPPGGRLAYPQSEE
jgi:hypothetical protein